LTITALPTKLVILVASEYWVVSYLVKFCWMSESTVWLGLVFEV